MPMIQAHALNLSFGTGAAINQVLHDVSLSVADGESFGLVGESGSGKTTVLRCLAGQYRHWHGALSIAGAPLQHKIPKEHFRKVQMVFQDPYGSLHPRHTIDTALREPLIIHGVGDKDDRINEILLKVGLNDSFRYRYPHQLSGGQRQRVAIARALAGAPGLVLADEPTAALDKVSGAEVAHLLRDLAKSRGVPILMVTHDPRILDIADRVVTMEDGRIVEKQ